MAGHCSSNRLPAGTSLVSRTGRPTRSDSAASVPGESLLSSVPSGIVISTGGGVAPGTGSAAKRADRPSSAPHLRGCLALATVPSAGSTRA